MKKILAIAVFGIMVLGTSNAVLASNQVSQMAITKGGQHVAQCAQNMDRGISECLQMLECEKGQ